MKKVRKSSQFKKDFKRIQNNPQKVAALLEVVTKLANGEILPKKMNPHTLSGQYKDYMECHIGPDYLLIWYDKIADTIELVRLGSHSELFKK